MFTVVTSLASYDPIDLVLGESEMLAGHFMHAVKRLPCSR